jgi:hypothetical protein
MYSMVVVRVIYGRGTTVAGRRGRRGRHGDDDNAGPPYRRPAIAAITAVTAAVSARTKTPQILRSPPAGPPPALPIARVPARMLGDGWPAVWWLGCHGGAGASTLARLSGIGQAISRYWPQPEAGVADTRVVLVGRASAAGAWAATGAVEQWRAGNVPPSTRVLGVAAVAASAKRPPRIAIERLQLLAGWVPSVWRIGWVDAFLAVDDPADLGMPPDVEAVRHAIQMAVQGEVGST